MSGNAPETLTEFAAQLMDWLEETYPGVSPIARNSVEEWIRETWRRRQGRLIATVTAR